MSDKIYQIVTDQIIRQLEHVDPAETAARGRARSRAFKRHSCGSAGNPA